MNNFKKNIFKKRTDDIVVPPITLFSASKMSYREMDLNNIAFCYSQIGNGTKSKEYYEKTLSEFPESIMAKTALKLINSAQNIENQKTVV